MCVYLRTSWVVFDHPEYGLALYRREIRKKGREYMCNFSLEEAKMSYNREFTAEVSRINDFPDHNPVEFSSREAAWAYYTRMGG